MRVGREHVLGINSTDEVDIHVAGAFFERAVGQLDTPELALAHEHGPLPFSVFLASFAVFQILLF